MSFSFPLTIYQNGFSGPFNAPAVTSLSVLSASASEAVILSQTEGARSPGLYVYDGNSWRFALPEIEVSRAIIRGYDLAVYYGVITPVTLPSDNIVFKNGVLQSGSVLTVGTAVYGVQIISSSPGAGVSALNAQTGVVALTGGNGIGVTTTAGNIQFDVQDLELDSGTYS